ETSAEWGSTLYHICEFAERFEARGCKDIFPLRSSLPDKCYSILESTGEMILITKGKKGYTPTGIPDEKITHREAANAANKAAGVAKVHEKEMVVDAMSGWDNPGAENNNYNEIEEPICPQKQHRWDER